MKPDCNNVPLGHPKAAHIRWESAGAMVRRAHEDVIANRQRETKPNHPLLAFVSQPDPIN